MSSFWADKISKAVGPQRKLPPPSIRQTPAASEQPADAADYLAKAREAIPGTQGVSVEERFSKPVEYLRPDGTKVSVPSRDSSDITVRQANRSWNTNSRQITQDGLFGDEATPQERAAAHQLAARDGRYLSQGDGGIYGSMTPWQRAAMLNDPIAEGVFNDAGHGDGGWFSEA